MINLQTKTLKKSDYIIEIRNITLPLKLLNGLAGPLVAPIHQTPINIVEDEFACVYLPNYGMAE